MSALDALFGEDAEILGDTNFQLVLLANIIPPLGTAFLSPVFDALIEPFGASPATIGLMMSVYTAPAIFMIPIAGVLADRYGRKPVMVLSLVLFGLAGTAIAFTTDFYVALGLRTAQGIAYGGITPILVTSLGDLYDGTREATAQGLRFTGSGIVQAVFPVFSGIIVTIAWYYPFYVYLLALPIALVLYGWFEEPADTTRPTADDADTGSYLHDLYALTTHRRALAMVVARGLPVTIWIGFLTYNSIIVIRVMDGTASQAGILVAIISTVYALSASQAGRITNLFGSRYYPLVGANVCLTVGFAIVLLAPVLVLTAVGVTIVGIGFGLTLPLYRSIITGLAPTELRGGFVSLTESTGRINATVTPIAMGAIIAVTTPLVGFATSVQLAGLVVAIVGGLGGILCLIVVHTSPPITLTESTG